MSKLTKQELQVLHMDCHCDTQSVRLNAAIKIAQNDPEFSKLSESIRYAIKFFQNRNIPEWKIWGIQNFDNIEK